MSTCYYFVKPTGGIREKCERDTLCYMIHPHLSGIFSSVQIFPGCKNGTSEEKIILRTRLFLSIITVLSFPRVVTSLATVILINFFN